jgi:signal peptidase I
MVDNRDNSADSRQMGLVPIENIVGRVTYIYLPFSRAAYVNNPYITP